MSRFSIIYRILAIIALCELVIMATFEAIPVANSWMAALLDCAALTLMAGLLMMQWVVKPLLKQEQENHSLKQEAEHQAHRDRVTGLVNRDTLLNHVDYLSESENMGPTPPIFFFIELDHFSVFSNSCGHLVADGLLKEITHAFENHFCATHTVGALGSTVPDSKILGRLGDDQFGLILYNCTEEEAKAVAKRLISVCQQIEYSWDTGIYKASCSIGMTRIMPGNTTTALMRQASSACHTAKDAGRGRIHFYRKGETSASIRHEEIDWVAKISHALKNDQFTLFQQTIAPLHSTETGDRFEILLRLDNGDGMPSLPWNLISAAERYGLVSAIDRWVITHTFTSLHKIYGPNTGRQLQSCSINLSGATLTEEWLLNLVCKQLDRYAIEPGQICFEITETMAISDEGNAQRVIGQLRDIGCRFALDDFGSGLSSFPYLKKYELDYLKIDGSLIKDITRNHRDRTMVESIVMMAHGLNLRVVAEWVEDEDILQTLREINVDFGQGYLIDKPQPLAIDFQHTQH